jgi:ADP-heptose:LPS heptosyltransferase/GT2 family glycosyltransferase
MDQNAPATMDSLFPRIKRLVPIAEGAGSARPKNPVFTEAAVKPGTDEDVLLGYQLLLGRDPENSQVITDAKSSPVRNFIAACLNSTEFHSEALLPMMQGRRLRHELSGAGPSARQLAWITRMIAFPEVDRAKLVPGLTWADFFTHLSGLDQFPRLDAPLMAAPAQKSAQVPPDFVMVMIESPAAASLAPGGMLDGAGFILAPDMIARIDVLLDGVLLTQARYGMSRPDIVRRYPHYSGIDNCGFSFSASLPADLDPAIPHDLSIVAQTAAGRSGERGLRLAPATFAPRDPFTLKLEVAEAAVEPGGVLRLRGIALSRHADIAIRVYLGEEELPQADSGLPSPEAKISYATYPNAHEAGFALRHRLENFDYQPANLRILASAADGETRDILVPLTLPRLAEVETAKQADGFHFCLDTAQLTPSGTLSVSGWALANAGIAAIGLWQGDKRLAGAEYGRARPDVARAYPAILDAAKAGFRVTASCADADDPKDFSLLLQARDGTSRRIAVEPLLAGDTPLPAGTAMRLEIDRPAIPANGTPVEIRASLPIGGWAIAPSGIATIEVFCGSEFLGRAYIGMRREDIAAAFPDYPGSLLAGYALVLPPGMLAPGEHMLRIEANASNGQKAIREFRVRAGDSSADAPGARLVTRVSRSDAALALRMAGPGAPHFHLMIAVSGAAKADMAALSATLASIAAQSYPHWQVTILPRRRLTPALIARYSAAWDKIPSLPKTRLTIAPEAAADFAPTSGGKPVFVMRLCEGDRLGADGLQLLAAAAGVNRGATMITADDARLDKNRGRVGGFAKPGFSPQLLREMNYLGRAFAANAGIWRASGLTGAALAQSGDWDIVLRLTEAAGQAIAHVPQTILRQGEAADDEAACRQALLGAIQRGGDKACTILDGMAPGLWRIARPQGPAKISVIMPSCGARDLVRQAIPSLRATATPHDLEIIVLDNTKGANPTLSRWLKKNADQLITINDDFNWSAFNNIGAAAASGDFLLFLNDDIEARQSFWLDALLDHARAPGTGVTGARLLYPDGKIQHGGQYLSGNHARHAFRFADSTEPGPFGLAQVAREMSSVTGACMMIRREVFEKLGGFNPAHSVVNNDLDLCFRARAAGLAVIYTPHATLIHHELASRAALDDTYDVTSFEAAWHLAFLRGDPYHSPRLLADNDHYMIDSEAAVTLTAGGAGLDRDTVRRILVLKLDHIGDFLTALPAVHALKARFPQAELYLLAPPATTVLARLEPVIDGIIEFSFFHARSADGKRGFGEQEYAALRAKLAALHFDIAIDLRMQPETREVLRETGAKLLAGYDCNGAFPWLDVALEWEGDTALRPKRGHVSERLVQLVAALDSACAPVIAETLMPMGPGRRPAAGGTRDSSPSKAADIMLPEPFRQRRFAVVHPGVGNPVRQWPAGHYAQLIDLLVAEAGLAVILIGTADEAEIAAEVLKAVQDRSAVISLAGDVKLADLPLLLREAALFIGNNSGPKHLAAALGVPTLGVHSGVIDPAEWAPRGERAQAIKREMSCSPCYLEFAADCPRRMACLTGLPPRAVFTASLGLLSTTATINGKITSSAPRSVARKR